LFFGAWGTFTGCVAKQPPKSKYNILLITIDSLRADHVGVYGYQPPTTPSLDAFARENIVFRNAYAPSPWTLPSHVSILTSLYPDVHGLDNMTSKLNKDAVTLAEILQKYGYWTGAVVCAPLLHRRYGLYYYFNEYDQDLVANTVEDARKVKTAARVTTKAVSMFDDKVQEPWFMFLHYWDPHYDYTPPREYAEIFDPDYQGTITGDDILDRTDLVPGMDPRDLQHIVALYDGEIRYTDDHLQRLFDELKRRDFIDNTIIIITADHGEEFLEHGGTGHSHTCYEEVLRVPFIVRIPGGKPVASTVDTPVSLLDIFPTVMDLLGLERRKLRLQGLSLAPLLTNGAPLEKRFLFAETKQGRKTPPEDHNSHRWSALISSDGWKVHAFRKVNTALSLYNLQEDPGEQHDLAAQQTTALNQMNVSFLMQKNQNDRMRYKLDYWLPLRPDKRFSDTLKGLGYLQ